MHGRCVSLSGGNKMPRDGPSEIRRDKFLLKPDTTPRSMGPIRGLMLAVLKIQKDLDRTSKDPAKLGQAPPVLSASYPLHT